MEQLKKEDQEHINSIINPIFNRFLKNNENLKQVPKETSSNHTMVGKYGSKTYQTVTPSLYNPHNYRLYFSFTKAKFIPQEGKVGVWFGYLKNHGKEFTTIGEGIRVTIKKTQAEIINKLSEEEWFLVNRARAKEEFIGILTKIDEKCITSFKKFIKIYGGSSNFVLLKRECNGLMILNTKCDNKVMQEPFIDSLPLDMTFETDIVKKVYKKPNVEFKEPIYAARYLENSALQEFNPVISNCLKVLIDDFSQLKPILNDLTEQIRIHLVVEKKQLNNQIIMNKSLRLLNRKLSQERLIKWF